MKIKLTIILIFGIFSVLIAGSVFFEYTAIPSTNEVTISWKTNSEATVHHFAVMRSSDDNIFVQIGTINAQGAGKEYKFVDKNVIFKGNQTFFYKIRAEKIGGSLVEETESLLVNPNISGIYRTWGAIKAMFQ